MTFQKVRAVLAEHLEMDEAEITMETTFQDLGVDSLDAVEIMIARCPEEGVRDLERLCRRLCESVIATYYASGTLVNSIHAGNLDKLLEPIYYK